MKVASRLYLAILPAILGVLTVAALAYWGQYAHAAPEWLVVAAAIAAVASLVAAWLNTRYVARTIERLAPPDRARSGAPDELQSLEQVMDQLSGAVETAAAERQRGERAAAERVAEYATLLAEASAAVSRQIEEVRLPLHILLENRFGELNENQEEMLGAARGAAEAADLELRRLREIAELDRGVLALRRDRIGVRDLLESLRPTFQAEGERLGVRLAMDLPPGLPAVTGDRVRLREAVELLIRHRVRHALPGTEVAVEAQAAGGEVAIIVRHGPIPTAGADAALAQRIIVAHGGTTESRPDGTRIGLPATPAAQAGSSA